MDATVPPPLIEFRGVSKTYGSGEAKVEALKGVDFTIEPGSFVAIMGPSGSGKSTVMNILGCLDVPTSGEYLFQGVPVSGLDRNERTMLRRHMIGFVFQGFNLLARTSAAENVALPLIYRGMAAKEREARALWALTQVGLADRATHTPAELSGGQQQRVAIARAIVTSPHVLLADEPTGNLDTRISREIMALITGFNRNAGLTVVMVTHEEDIAAYAQRVIRFVDGRLESDKVQEPSGVL
ncbi:MAG: ABC transporter ATP-binding protein [Rhizobiales bacterium]|nr:ABC transporter ATP-binding protein [Hyphomicrobiales bacterium]OJU29695.1 MAG: macrolide ABC transporter ATP-binding protein [Rhizobiales bacterium 68-8]